MDLLDYAVDASAAEDGVWVDVEAWLNKGAIAILPEPPKDRACMRITRWLSQAHDAARARETEQLRRVARVNEPDSRVESAALNRSLAGLITDWRGFSVGGKEHPYSQEGALAFMADPKWVRLRELVTTVANTEAAYRAKRSQEAAGN